MKPYCCFLSVAALVGLTETGCRTQAQPEVASAFHETLRSSSYTAWSRAPDYDTPQPTVGAHGDLAIIYLNDAAQTVMATAEGPWPEGVIIVKDSFDEDDTQTPTVTAAMEKRADGWFWAEWDAEGNLLYSGGGADAPGVCTGCHEGGDDFVLGVFR